MSGSVRLQRSAVLLIITQNLHIASPEESNLRNGLHLELVLFRA